MTNAHTLGTSGSYTDSGYTVQGVSTTSAPVADFSANTTSGSAPLAVEFTDSSSNSPTSWSWDFGDGSTSSEENPTHTYTTAGTYTVTLTATNGAGNSTVTQNIMVTLAAALTANFTSNTTSGFNPLTVQFTDKSTGNATSWAWDFNGDGVIDSTLENPVYTYTTPGNYTVTLTVTNASGNSTISESGYITVINGTAPVVTATLDAGIYNSTQTVTLTSDEQGSTIYYTTDGSDPTDSSNSNRVPYSNPIPINTTTTLNFAAVSSGSVWSTRYNKTYVIDASVPTVTASPVGGDYNSTQSVTLTTVDLDTNTTTYYTTDGTDPQNSGSRVVYTSPIVINTSTTLRYIAVDEASNWSTEYSQTYNITAAVPVADFTSNATTGIAPLTVQFNDTSSGNITDWVWDFNNDGIIDSTVQNPTWNYTAPGNYTVKETVTGPGGSNTITQNNYITVNWTAPVANFTASVTSGLLPVAVNFTDKSQSATSWLWDFGDGSTSTLENPTHTYINAGNYSVSLTASNPIGNNKLVKTGYIQISNIITNYQGMYLLMSNHNGTAYPDGGLANTYLFTSGGLNQIHITNNASNVNGQVTTNSLQSGVFYITTTGGRGSNDDLILLIAVKGSIPDDFAINIVSSGYVWTPGSTNTNTYVIGAINDTFTKADFFYGPQVLRPASASMGVIYNGQNTNDPSTAMYLMFVDLKVGNLRSSSALNGGAATVQYNITGLTTYLSFDSYAWATGYDAKWTNPATGSGYNVLTSPVANFTANTTVGMSPFTVKFTDTSSNLPSSWAWDFNNDGIIDSTAQNPIWTYTTPGLYNVVLTVTNVAGNSTLTKTDYIRVDMPLANFIANVTTGNNSMSVQFNDTSSNNPTSWLWNFGDGSTSTEQNPVHPYSKAGTYNVSLAVTNSYGTDSEVKTDYINIVDTIPNVNASVPGGLYNSTQSVGLTTDDNTATSYYYLNGNGSKYNGPITIGSNSTLVYFALDNMGNLSPMYTQVYTIVPLPVANFTSNVASGLDPLTVQFTDSSTGIVTGRAWDFNGDGIVDSTLENPIWTYTVPGNYNVTLMVTNIGGYNILSQTGYITVYNSTAPIVTAIPDAGAYNTTQNVTLTADQPGCKIYYTTDGSDPTDASNSSRVPYSVPIPIANTTTVNFAAVNEGGVWSTRYNKTYVIDTSTPVVTVTPEGGLFNSTQMVTLNATDADTAPTTYYTTDGSDPQSSGTRVVYTSPIVINTTTILRYIAVDAVSNWSPEYSQTYTIIPLPVASFTSNATSGIAPVSVQFNDTTTGNVTSWNWDFGDGNSSTEQNPVHTYTKAGEYTVSLVAGNVAGSNTVTQINYLSVLLNDVYVSPTGNDTTGDGTTTNPYATIQNGLNNVVAGGTIHLASGTYTGTGNKGLTITKNVNIIGEGQTNTIIDAQNLSNIFTLNQGVTVTIANLALENGNTTYGGAIYNNGTLNVSNSTFTGNYATKYGGVIYTSQGSTTSVSGSTFTSNSAKTMGGVIYTSQGSTTSVSGSTFTGNKGNSGGVIYNIGNLAITDCNFTNNTGINGGTIYNKGNITSLSGCTFTNNTNSTTVAGNGGAVYNQGNITSLIDCTFTGNSMTNAGAIYNGNSYSSSGTVYGNMAIIDCTFTNNTASTSVGSGGAILNYGIITSLSGCTFTGNAANFGGAVYNVVNITNVNNCTFTGNSAPSAVVAPANNGFGGAIYSIDGTMGVSDCTFTGNSAGTGGAIYNYGTTSNFTVNFSSFLNNTVVYGGSAVYQKGGTFNAKYNWWGSNSDPSSQIGISTQIGGTIDYSNWLYMTETVNPTAIINGSTANVTVSFNNIWNGTGVSSIDPANGHIPDGTVVTFTSSLGSFSPVTVTTSNGTATTTFTAATVGVDVINATTNIQTVSGNVTVCDVPVANFTANATTGNNTLSVQFADNSSNIPSSWVWDLNGDGVIDSTLQNPTWTYSTPGVYTVVLTVTNVAGNNTLTRVGYITVYDTIPPTVTTNVTSGAYNTPQEVGLTVSENATIYYALNGGAITKYTGPITINNSATLAYFAMDTAGNISPIYIQTYVIDTIAPTVTANVTNGIFNSTQTVSLTSDDGSSTIYYTIDGSDPTVSSTVYTGPITVSNTTTLKYVAVDEANNASPSYTQTYIIDTMAPNVTANGTGGVFNKAQTVVLTSDDPTATIYYTTDGTDPTTSSTVYTGAISISNTTTLKYVAVDEANNASPIYTETYIIDMVAPTVTANVTSGVFNSAQTVVLTSDDVNSTIYYTTDGTDPSRLYTGTITVANTTTLKYLAVDGVGNQSPVYTQSYVIDTTAPSVKSVDPVKNAVNVVVDKVIKVTFSEAIKAGTSWFELKTSSGAVVQFTSSINANVLTITPKALTRGTKYALILHTGSVTDLASNNLAYYGTNFVTTTDGVAPSVKSVDPVKNAVNVAVDKVIKVTFSEAIKAGTSAFELRSSNGTVVNVTPSISGNVLTLTPASALTKGTRYSLILHTGSVMDLVGNNVAYYGTYFTTDSVAPTVKSVDPVKSAVNVAVNKVIKVTFSEPIKAGTSSFELRSSNGTVVNVTPSISANVLTLTPVSALIKGTSYSLILHTGSVKDLAGNNLAYYGTYFTTSKV